MKYKDASKLHNNDEVVVKKTGEILRVSFIERYEREKSIFVFCDDGNEYHHRELR